MKRNVRNGSAATPSHSLSKRLQLLSRYAVIVYTVDDRGRRRTGIDADHRDTKPPNPARHQLFMPKPCMLVNPTLRARGDNRDTSSVPLRTKRRDNKMRNAESV
eukprot:3889889-Pyramimonas_sp.AAC.1